MLIKFMEILKSAYSQIKTKFQSAIPTLETGNFLHVNDYDHAFRLKEVHHKVSTNPEVLMASYEYNELGQVTKKKLNENVDGSFLQEIDYEYNIRGWRTKINDPDNLEIAGEPKDMFAMQLHYNDVLPTVNNTGDEQYNGNIAAIKWNTPEFGVKAYGYGYDNLSRLERARFAAGAALNVDVDKFTVENITYDANGNILTLGRHNTATGYIDNLTMTYDGNQLKKTHDSGDLALGFVDMVDTETEYHYDLNGSMDIDDNKGFTFAYNHLNLPKGIVGGNDTVRYIYSAAGVKISKELAQSGAVSYTDYVGNFVYKDGDLDYILTSEGRITEPVSGTLQYEYFLKDYLGNTRTVFADGNNDGVLADNEVLQETHYYPFGMSIGDLAVDRGADNKIKLGGKELQDDLLGGVSLALYDFEARYKMNDIPVFTTIDPLAEIVPGITPYHYCYNSPANFTDPTGMIANAITSTFIDPDGNILDVRDDGDRNIYLVHDPDNWDGSTDGLATVGHTPEPATLKNFVGKNLYTEEVAGYMYDEAERIKKEASIYVDAFQVGSLAQLMQDRDEMLKLLDEMKNLSKEQLAIALKIMRNNELRLNDYYRNDAEDNVAGMRILLRLTMFLTGQLSGVNVDDQDYGVNYVIPESTYDDIDAKFEAKSQEIINKYNRMIENNKNK